MNRTTIIDKYIFIEILSTFLYSSSMNFEQFLEQEWVPALGCTEPASIAYAGLLAASELDGPVKKIKLTVDPKIYKNCYSVGIPHSGHKTGIKWAAAIGAFLKNKDAELQCFADINDDVLKSAERVIKGGAIDIEIDRSRTNLYVDIIVSDGAGVARTVIEDKHTNVTLIELNRKAVFENRPKLGAKAKESARKWAASLSIGDLLGVVRDISDAARKKIREGVNLNLKIAEHGLTLLPKAFTSMTSHDPLARIASHVCGGVYARMGGEDFPVMSVAGSGNKGITSAVPLLLLEKEWELAPGRTEEAIALAILFTSKTTEELGSLSAVCGCSNAAGIGLACAIVYLKGGGEREISFAINNMVGNVTGMICDGAKIGCALKTMTAVDAAFRASALAISGMGIPVEDGIVGATGSESLINMGKIAKLGMTRTDDEILKIMEEKL
jgi:L-cysteine desulfidase